MLKQVKIRRSIVFGLLLIGVTILVFKKISTKAQKIENKTSFQKLSVQAAEVKNKDQKLLIDLSGKLVAKNRIDIFSEVSGVLLSNSFREGKRFSKGQVLARIDDSELRATVKSQKSVLLNSVAQILPDIAIDFPNEIDKWKAFHAAIDFDKSLPLLPEISNDKLKMFISSRNVFSNYFSIKAQEVRLAKHVIKAPFSGSLSSTDINTGTLVRAGQRIGSFIQPNAYELEASVSLDDLKFIDVGRVVTLSSAELDKTWAGKVLRINEQLDPSTQSVKVYVGVNDPTLKEGQYLTAIVEGVTLNNVVSIPRSLLVGKTEIYLIENDSVLTKENINVVYKGTEWMYVRNLEDGTKYLNQTISSVHEGMIVTVLNNEE